MRQDRFGCAITTTSDEAVAAWDAMAMAFLAHAASTPTHLNAALDADPDLAAAHAARGLFSALLGRSEMLDVARSALADARRSAARRSVSPREAALVEALAEWLANRPSGAVARLDATLAREAHDALTLKLSHSIRFVLGDGAGMRRSLEAAMPAYGPDHAAHGYALGCHAFALEETGEHAAAEAAGRAGLERAADDAWGLHAVAHVHDMRGDAGAGLAWLDGREAAWAHCNNFRYHVWWHKALMLLDLGRGREALALYDAEVRAERTDDYRDLSNAASLLMRLELEGVAVGDRWEELACISERRTGDGCLIFADLHYLLALVGGRRQEAAAALLARIARDAGGRDEVSARMASPGVEAARGLAAFGAGHHESAFAHLLRARPAMRLAGGSIAQRDVFERVTVEAGLRAGRLDDAEVVLRDRLRRRGGREDGFHASRMAAVGRARSDTTALPAAE